MGKIEIKVNEYQDLTYEQLQSEYTRRTLEIMPKIMSISGDGIDELTDILNNIANMREILIEVTKRPI